MNATTLRTFLTTTSAALALACQFGTACAEETAQPAEVAAEKPATEVKEAAVVKPDVVDANKPALIRERPEFSAEETAYRHRLQNLRAPREESMKQLRDAMEKVEARKKAIQESDPEVKALADEIATLQKTLSEKRVALEQKYQADEEIKILEADVEKARQEMRLRQRAVQEEVMRRHQKDIQNRRNVGAAQPRVRRPAPADAPAPAAMPAVAPAPTAAPAPAAEAPAEAPAAAPEKVEAK